LVDGDVVFATSMGVKPLPDPVFSLSELGMLAANVLARAIARGVYEATSLPFNGALQCWRDHFA
jgi:L-aminopeptidase/D-esterase-like protein